jgi:nicotinamidase-related amidase
MEDRHRASTEDREPAPGGVGLVIVDMMNRLAFDGAEELARAALAIADPILSLREQADRAGVPVIYVNDNDDEWHSERTRIVENCLAEDSRGRELAQKLAPRRDDFFVIKPRFSGFYATNLPVLLPRLGVTRLVLTGIAGDICVLFTAADAHMRDYGLWVPADAIASNSTQRTDWALDIMASTMGAETRGTDALRLDAWVGAQEATTDG